MDFLIRRFALTEENVKQRFENILSNGVDTGITYEIQKIEKIRKEDEYGGFRVTVICRLENIKQFIPLDIATGDPITPKAIDYEYKSIFNDTTYDICAYSIETILAEKLRTIVVRGVFNGRSKDYYDIYALYHLKNKNIDFGEFILLVRTLLLIATLLLRRIIF